MSLPAVAESSGPSVVELKHASPAQRPSRRIWVSGLCLIIIGVVVGLVASQFLGPKEGTPAQVTGTPDEPAETPGVVAFDQEKQAAVGLTVAEVVAEPLHMIVWRPGRVALHDDRVSHICPPAEGIVRDTPIRLGQAVQAGDVLAVIESRELGQAKLDVYKARIAVAAEREVAQRTRTAMANAQELLTLLEADTPIEEIERKLADRPIGDYRQQLLAAYTRKRQLAAQLAFQRGSIGAIPETAILKTQADSEAATAAYTSLVEELRFQVKNQVRQADLNLREIETAFEVAKAKLVMLGLSAQDAENVDPIKEGAIASHMMIRAPFAGIVVEKHAVRSERVTPQSQMFIVADLSKLWIQADVYESDLPIVRELQNREVLVRSLSAGISERQATVTYTGDLIDKSSRTLTLTAELMNPDRMLKPGLFVEVGLDTGDKVPMIQLPSSAILHHANQPFVFVQTGPESFRQVKIVLRRSVGDRKEVTSGLKPGDRVVMSGGFILKSEMLKDQMVGE